MDLRDLKLFLLLADSRHFGKTAKASYISPSTLSRQIRRIEEELGYSLFLRDNRTVELTKAGYLFKQFAQKTLVNFQDITQSLKQDNALLKGELRLFCSVTAAYSHLPGLLDRFRDKQPEVEIKLTTGDAADAIEKIQSNMVDIAIAGQPTYLPGSIGFISMGEIPLVIIAPALSCPVNKLIKQNKIDWSSVPFILPEHGPTRHRIDHWFRKTKIANPLIYATVAGHEAIVSMVALGCGVALIPDVVLDNSPEAIRNRIIILNNIHVPSAFDLGVFVYKKRLDEPVINAFWQLL